MEQVLFLRGSVAISRGLLKHFFFVFPLLTRRKTGSSQRDPFPEPRSTSKPSLRRGKVGLRPTTPRPPAAGRGSELRGTRERAPEAAPAPCPPPAWRACRGPKTPRIRKRKGTVDTA